MTELEARRQIDRAIAINSETDLVEFKKATGGFSKKTVRKTLSAFGNCEGGFIVFGVAEEENKERELRIVGLTELNTIQEQMSQLSAEEMSSVLRLSYFQLDYDDLTILAVYVPPCLNNEKPYYYKSAGLPLGAYIRDGNTDRVMTKDEMEGYIRNARSDDFDSTCITNLDISDLSSEKIEGFLKGNSQKVGRDFDTSEDYNRVLKNIGLVTICDSKIRPTLAGYLIFAKDKPQTKLDFKRYIIRCIRYSGSGAHTDILDSLDIDGTIDNQLDLMHAFILRNIRKTAKIVGTKRVERYEYPEKAIREIVANAVIHRDYRITETYTQISIFEDRIEISNPGNLPAGVTIENIKSAQMSRNKIISNILKDMEYLEEYGRGIDIVFSKMSEWNLLPPIFKNTSNSFKVILPGKKLSSLNERQIKIWSELVETQKITRRSIEEIDGVMDDITSQTINNDLRKMKDLGLILQKGESSNTFYVPSF